MRPAQKRIAAQELIDDYRASVVRVCKLIMLHRSLWYYKSSRRDDTVIRMRMREIAMTRVTDMVVGELAFYYAEQELTEWKEQI